MNTPWKTADKRNLVILDGYDYAMCECASHSIAEYIVTAVNEHEALKERAKQLEKLLNECTAYIEESEVDFDAEFGSCRKLHELIEHNDMPDIYKKVKSLLTLCEE